MKHLKYLAILMMVLVAAACSDEPVADSQDNTNESYIVSTFTVDKDDLAFPENLGKVSIALIGTDGVTHCYPAEVSEEASRFHFNMRINKSKLLPDGNYVMTLRPDGGKPVGGRLLAKFADYKLASVAIILPGYMLSGSGTQDDPYLIANSDDFELFIMNLSDDAETNGAGLYFRQTGDVVPTDQSPYAPGRGYWGAPFAGIYDGGGHEISNLYYRGEGRNGSDTSFGLFTELRGTATVSNVIFTGVNVTGLYSNSGILAGRSAGSIEISGVKLRGSFSGSNNSQSLGGLVGNHQSGTLSIRDVEMSAAIAGHDQVGGLVGLAKGELSISDITTPDYHFSVEGNSNVGGLIGRTEGKLNISSVRLEHKVSNEDSDIRIVKGTDGSSVGGIAGTIGNSRDDAILTDIEVCCPVGGSSSQVGGIVGNAYQLKTLSLNSIRFKSVVSGKTDVGGIIGRIDMGNYVGDCHIGNGGVKVIVDDSDASVKGESQVGGFAGYFECTLSQDADIVINIPVSASNNNVGGAFGRVQACSLSLTRVTVGTSADGVMKVVGGNNAGGLVGYAEDASISGSSRFDFAVPNTSTLAFPDPANFTSAFSCVVRGGECVGGIVGKASWSYVGQFMADGKVEGNAYVGGIAGMVNDRETSTHGTASLSDLIFNGTLNCPDAKYVGGVVGGVQSFAFATMTDCVNYSHVIGNDQVGGVVGRFERAKHQSNDYGKSARINWCVNAGSIEGTLNVGGVAGLIWCEDAHSGFNDDNTLAVEVSSCCNRGKVRGKGNTDNAGTAGVGGIVGLTNFRIGIVSCANHGDVTAEGALQRLGGVAGSMGHDPSGSGLTSTYRNVMLSQCCNTATVNSSNSSCFVGGLLGYQEEGNKSDVLDCWNSGAVPSKQNHDNGGIVGCVDHLTNIYRCFNRGMVSHGNAMIGTHKSGSLFDHGSLYYIDGTGKGWPSASKVSESKKCDQSSYNGFDFSKVWTMSDQGPILRNCPWQ